MRQVIQVRQVIHGRQAGSVFQNFQLRHVKAIFRGGPGNPQQERIVYEKFDLGWSKSVKTNSYPLVFDSYIETNLTLLKK